MKIIILIQTCLTDSGYKKLYEKQKVTWDSVEVNNVSTLYVIGNGNKKEISGHFAIDTSEELYDNQTIKLINAFELINNINYNYVFIANASSYVDKKMLYEWMLDKPRKRFYSGVICSNWISGAGFFLSKDVVNLIIDNKDEFGPIRCGDTLIGKFLSEKGIDMSFSDRFDIVRYCDNIPTNYFNYRCKDENYNKELDMQHFQRIFDLKNKK
jgi:hypothetical protein